MSFRSYLFDAIPKNDGSLQSFCRFDVAISAGVALALMYAYVFSLGTWTLASACKCAAAVLIAAVLVLLTTPRRLVLGAALSIITLRLAFGLLFLVHTMWMFAATIVCGFATFILLKTGDAGPW
jgi:hypothetical protein